MIIVYDLRDRVSAVGIATRYGLDGPGIESRWGRDFPHPYWPALGPTQHPIQWIPGLSPGVKRPGRGVEHPPTSSTDVEGRVELYICFPTGPSWPVLGRGLPLPLVYDLPVGSEKNSKNLEYLVCMLRFTLQFPLCEAGMPVIRPEISVNVAGLKIRSFEVVVYVKVLSRCVAGETETKHGNCHLRWPVIWL